MTNVMGAVRYRSVATEDNLAQVAPAYQVTFPEMHVPFNPEGNT
jgi:hypothetical protein